MKQLHFHILRCCSPCTGTRRAGKVLRTLVLIFNILYWLCGCAIICVSVWMTVVNPTTKGSYSISSVLGSVLIGFLVTGILFLIVSCIGVFSANRKNKFLVALAIISTSVLAIAEVIGVILLEQNRNRIKQGMSSWYSEIFDSHMDNNAKSLLVHSVESSLKCCGLIGYIDYKYRFKFENAIPESCKGSHVITGDLYTRPVYPEGCLDKIVEQVSLILDGYPVWIFFSIILVWETMVIAVESFYLIYLLGRGKMDKEEEDYHEETGLIQSVDAVRVKEEIIRSFSYFKELPFPKLYRVVRNSCDSSFGAQFHFDYVQNCHVITNVEINSYADLAGITPGSQLIEINGVAGRFATSEELENTIAKADKEILLLVADPLTRKVYDDHKVTINLRNVEGITRSQLKYKPRLCKVDKLNGGFGFSLLCLEDRKGEYVEQLTPNGPGEKAGLRVGDRIIEVNGVNVEREKSSDVVKRIRMSNSVIHLLVVDSKTDGFFRKKAVTITASLDAHFFRGRGEEDYVPCPEMNLLHVKPRCCLLERSPEEEFGLYIVMDNARIGHVIRWVDCGGVADRAGLRIGDRIVEVNGQNVEYEPHQRLIEAIQRGETTAHVIVTDEDYDRVYRRNEPRSCRIFKEKHTFGFSVEYDTEKEGYYVGQVSREGPAFRGGLKAGDRIVQLNGRSIEREHHKDVFKRLRSCKSTVDILVVDDESNEYYKRLVEFKKNKMDVIDYDNNSMPREPIFISQTYDYTDDPYCFPSLTSSFVDSLHQFEIENNLKQDTTNSLTGEYVLEKADQKESGFSSSGNQTEKGEIRSAVVKGNVGESARPKTGNRVVSGNDQSVEEMKSDDIASRVFDGGNNSSTSLIDSRSDNLGKDKKPFLIRIIKENEGFGFYLWHDTDGHYVENVDIGSPADKAGLRCGDRLLEINGANIESETHENVFYLVKACANIVSLLIAGAETFAFCKNRGLNLTSRNTELSGDIVKDSESAAHLSNDIVKKVSSNTTSRQEVTLIREVFASDYGFKLAYSNSFIDSCDQKVGHIVHWVKEGEAAHLAGLRHGDRIISVDDVNVENEDHEQVVMRIHGNGRNWVKILVEYEKDNQDPHDIKIDKNGEDSFGFHLWFDENGHYIENVIVGSCADKAGLKSGDRLIEINFENVENESHEATVLRLKESGKVVRLKVISVRSDEIVDNFLPKTLKISKARGSFGFCIKEDIQGLYVEYVQPVSSADLAGLSIGDRLLKINEMPTESMTQRVAVEEIQKSMNSVEISVLSMNKKWKGNARFQSVINGAISDGFDDNPTVKPIYKQLFEKEKIDYVIEGRHYNPTNHKEAEHKTKEMKRTASKKKEFPKLKTAHYAIGMEEVIFSDEEEKNSKHEHNLDDYLDFTLKRAKKPVPTQRKKTREVKPGNKGGLNIVKRNSTSTDKLPCGATRRPRTRLPTSEQLKLAFGFNTSKELRDCDVQDEV